MTLWTLLLRALRSEAMSNLPGSAKQPAFQQSWLGFTPVQAAQPLSSPAYCSRHFHGNAFPEARQDNLRSFQRTPPGLTQACRKQQSTSAVSQRPATAHAQHIFLPPRLPTAHLLVGSSAASTSYHAAAAAAPQTAAPLIEPGTSDVAQQNTEAIAKLLDGVGRGRLASEAAVASEQSSIKRQPRPPEDPAARSTGMAVTWLGTSSGAPTKRRNVSSIALRTPSQTLIVDAGEGTNRQVAVAGIDPGSINNIFITHMHGDHCFGLPGLLTAISAARAAGGSTEVLHIFGPPGIQDLLESTLGFSGSRLAMPIIVAEFTVQPERGAPPIPSKGFPGMSCAFVAPDFTERAKQALQQTNIRLRPDYRRDDQMALHGVEVVDGLTWTIACDFGVTVTAAQLQHRVPCWGYVFKEADTPPSERPGKLQECGLGPGEALAKLQQGLGPNSPVELPSGSTVLLRELLHPPVPGRKVVLLGDTCDSRAIAEVGRGADLLSHEATFSRNMAHKAHKAQHSTAEMAGRFARQIGASTLILTHFSSRYSKLGNGSQDKSPKSQGDDASVTDLYGLLQEAKQAFGRDRVFPAQDFFTYEVLNRAQLAAEDTSNDPARLAGPLFSAEEEGAGSPGKQRFEQKYSQANREAMPRRGGRAGGRGRGGGRGYIEGNKRGRFGGSDRGRFNSNGSNSRQRELSPVQTRRITSQKPPVFEDLDY